MKKKLIALMLACLMLLSITGTALAEEPALPDTQAVVNEVQANDNSEGKLIGQYSVKNLTGYAELLKLRAEGKATREQIRANQVKIKDAEKQARLAKKDIKAIVLAYRTQHKQLSADLKNLWTTQKANWAAMKAARQAKDKAKMQAVMTQILTTRQAINAKLVEIKTAQEKLLLDLQNAPAKAPKVKKTPKSITPAPTGSTAD
ncbi:MAG: hypothetical protein ACM3PP_13970 [Candidatus Saccharibacteria bacterium]